MGTDRHSVIWKGIKREENKLRQILDKMKNLSDIKQLLKEIKDEPMRCRDINKKKWYKIGKYLLDGNKLVMHKEIQIAAWRAYQYYSKVKKDWDRPSPRQLSKMKKLKFLDLLKGREELEREILLAFSNEVQSHMMEGHEEMEHMICYGSMEVQNVICQ